MISHNYIKWISCYIGLNYLVLHKIKWIFVLPAYTGENILANP